MEALAARQVHVVRDAIDWLTRQSGSTGDLRERWIEHVVTHLEDAMGVVQAAVLCDDATIIGEELEWHEHLVADDRIETELALAAFESLRAVMPRHSNQATALLERAIG